MANAPRLQALEERHAKLEMMIAEEDGRPRPNETELARLKREKLKLRDEMEKLRRED